MNPAFENLDKTKRNRIINAALEEFAKHGYDKASTNSIVKNAAISKGLLFHYFSNKKTLYDYLGNWSFEVIITTMSNSIDWSESDYFKRIEQAWQIKSRVLLEYPYLAKFGDRLLEDTDKAAVMVKIAQYDPNIIADLYTKNIDFSKFKSDIAADRAANIIKWTLEKVGENYKPQLNETDAVFLNKVSSEIDVYLKLLKRTFYKEEALDD